MAQERIPLSPAIDPEDYLLKVFGAAHSDNSVCLSQPTQGTNLIVVEYDFRPIKIAPDLSYISGTNLHDCIGSKSEILSYFERLRSGHIRNTQGTSVHYVPPLTRPVRLQGDEWFARIKTTFVYKETKDGLGALRMKLDLDSFSCGVIAYGKEYNFLQSKSPLRSWSTFSDLRQGIEESQVYGSMDQRVTRVRANLEEAKEAKTIDLVAGGLAVYPPKIGDRDLVSPSYVLELERTIRHDILREERRSDSVADYIVDWSPAVEKVYVEMYKRGLFRHRISGSRDSGLKRYHKRVAKSSGIGSSYTNLFHYAATIQDGLDSIEERFVEDKSGIESRLVYEILRTKERTEQGP